VQLDADGVSRACRGGVETCAVTSPWTFGMPGPVTISAMRMRVM
jgi:hypothetical protein